MSVQEYKRNQVSIMYTNTLHTQSILFRSNNKDFLNNFVKKIPHVCHF